MGRKKQTVVRKVTHADLDVITKLRERYHDKVNATTRMRICREFIAFAALNSFDLHTAMESWIGVQRRADLKWSTLDSYCHYVRKFIKSNLIAVPRMLI